MSPLKGGLRGVNGRGGGVQEGIVAQPGDSSLHCASVDSGEGRSVRGRIHYPLFGEKGGQGGPARRLKSRLHATGARVCGYQLV